MVVLHYGLSDVHEFWEGKTLLIFRNLPEKYWQSMKKNQGQFTVIDDNSKEAQRRIKKDLLLSITLGAFSSGELAKKIEAQEGIEIRFNHTKVYKGKPPMRLVKEMPPIHALRSSKK